MNIATESTGLATVTAEKAAVAAEVTKIEPKEVENKEAAKNEPENKELENVESGTEKKDGAEEKPDDIKSKNQENAWKRITEKNKRLAEKLELLQKQLTEPKSIPVNENITETNATDTAPTRDSFRTENEYISAVIKFQIEKQAQQIRDELQQERQQAEIKTTWNQKESEVKTKYPDYDDVISEQLILPNEAIHAVLNSPIGPELRYYLGTHEEEAAKINQLDAINAVREIGKIEARIEMDSDSKAKPPEKVSKAPAPIKPIGSKGSVPLNDDQLSDDAWFRKRQKEKLAGKTR